MDRPCRMFLLLALAACAPSAPPAPDLAAIFGGTSGRWVDLTHAFSDRTIFWPTDTLGFRHEQLAFGPTPAGHFYSAYRYSAAEHGGTHLDAPIHFAEGKVTADQLPLTALMGPAVVIDVTASVTPDTEVGITDFEAWEGTHGRIPEQAIVLLRTGWDARYTDRSAYLGTARVGPAAIPDLHFPGLAPEAARWLVAERRVKAFGLDTPSIDRGQSTTFGAHVALATAEVPGFENVANLGELPATGSFVMALPMKIADGSGGPLRIVAYIP